MENRINLNNFKVVIFDFDNTLAIHNDKDYLKNRNQSENSLFNYYSNAYLNSDYFYETIEPCTVNDTLKKLIDFFEFRNVKMYCVSGMKFSFNFKAKEYFIQKNYSKNIEVVSVGSQQLKVDAIKIIQRINSCSLNEILFIDEIKENVIRFNDIGVCALLPDDINDLVNEEI